MFGGIKRKKYLWCTECNSALHDTTLYSTEFHKPLKFNTRIHLENEFDNVKVLMGQSPGRAGLTKTNFIIIEEYFSKYQNLLTNLVGTDITDTDSITKQIKELNKITNRINKNIKYMTHKNKTDTDFRIYPRFNKKKDKKRYIPGPVDVSLNFNINFYTDQKNGIHWPMGVFNIDDFEDRDNIYFELLFNNNENKILGDFFNTIAKPYFNRIKKSFEITEKVKHRYFKRALLLQIPSSNRLLLKKFPEFNTQTNNY